MSHQALLLEEVGAPLVLGTRPTPQPGKDQLLVKVLVAGLNPHDHRSRDVGLFVNKMPFLIGNDLVGEVLQVGTGDHAATFSKGDHVFTHTFAEGGFDNDFNAVQEYALVDARYAAKVADTGLSDDEACTIPVVLLAPFIALFASSGHGLPAPFTPEAKTFDFAGITLLIIGGGSNTGRTTVEVAKLAGIGQIIVVAGQGNEATLKSLGATHFIDRSAPDALEQIRAIVGDELVYAIDTVNPGLDQELGVAALSNTKKGTLVTLRHPTGELDPAKIGPKSAGYDRRLVFGLSTTHPEITVGFWKEAPKWLKEGAVRPSSFEVIKGLDADAVNKALDGYRELSGPKFNIHPWE